MTDGQDITFFRPDEDTPPAEWLLEGEDGEVAVRKEGLLEIPLKVGMLPKDYREAVEREWNLRQAQEALAEADMACGGVAMEIGDLQAQLYEYKEMGNPPRYAENLTRCERELAELTAEFTKLDDERDKAETRLRELRENE